MLVRLILLFKIEFPKDLASKGAVGVLALKKDVLAFVAEWSGYMETRIALKI